MTLRPLIPILLGILLVVSVFLAQKNTTSLEKVEKAKCPQKLASVLCQLTRAKDYGDFARIHGLDVVGNKVRVSIELNNSEYNLPSEFGTVEIKRGTSIQAKVYIDKLLDMTTDSNIRFVGVPSKLIPLGS